MKDRHFSLNEKVATIVAQIACFEDTLPQGSPCSPIISNLIGHLLDVKLVGLAKKYKCTYSRYADDITFSTNLKDFPKQLAMPVSEGSKDWDLGPALKRAIERTGFSINDGKTRMQYRTSRQVTTGLIVNKKVNVAPEYYRNVRAMCRNLFQTGSYYRVVSDDQNDGAVKQEVVQDLHVLGGMLAHIHQVKSFSSKNEKTPKSSAKAGYLKLYERFLFYKNFVALRAPLIVTEGITDPIYLKAAIKNLADFQPRLGVFDGEIFGFAIKFLNYTPTVRDVMHMGGDGGINYLLQSFERNWGKTHHGEPEYPIILLIDNDDGAKNIFKTLKSKGVVISYDSDDAFFHVVHNLYLVKTPQNGSNAKSCIEDFFTQELLDTEIGGKKFNLKKDHESEGEYGKVVFAKSVVAKNSKDIDFSNFSNLLGRIVAVLDHYAGRVNSQS